MAKNNARLYDPSQLITAGIDPKTGLPLKYVIGNGSETKANIKKQLRIIDEQDAINRFTWYNLPEGLNSRLIERILYYKGQAMFFFFKEKFYFLPYVLDGTIDIYGRFMEVSPLPFNGTANDGKPENPWIQGLTFEPRYEIANLEDFLKNKSTVEIQRFIERSCVILKDYTEQYSQTIISRQILNDSILDVMSDCIPFMRTALLNSTGVQGVRVPTEDEASNVYAASEAINKSALDGKKYIPIVGPIDFQDMTSGNVAKSEEFMLAMQSLDNYRLSLYGLENGGLFQKKAHMLEAEQKTNNGNVGLVLRDSLQYRQDFCNIVNSIWGLDIWCEASEVVLNLDLDGDMVAGSNEDSNTNQGGADVQPSDDE